MNLIACRTLSGGEKLIPADQLVFRPSVYGLVLHNNALLLAQSKHTGRYLLPGGGIEKGEAIEAALMREVYEETGITIAVQRLLHVETFMVYHDVLDVANHAFLFFYCCVPLSIDITTAHNPSSDDAILPRWIARDTLSADTFQSQGDIILELLDTIA